MTIKFFNKRYKKQLYTEAILCDVMRQLIKQSGIMCRNIYEV